MTHRIGAILYILWGLVHLAAAYDAFLTASAQEPGLVQGRLMQEAWYIGFFSILAIAVAVTMNWRNSRTGYFVNLVAVSAADLGFILFVLLPGHIPPWPGLLGPVLWLLAAIFTTLGVRRAA